MHSCTSVVYLCFIKEILLVLMLEVKMEHQTVKNTHFWQNKKIFIFKTSRVEDMTVINTYNRDKRPQTSMNCFYLQ